MTDVIERAKKIKLLSCDVDGVMTDGALLFTSEGQEIKAFNILDGQGIKMLQNSGVKVCIITGRTSAMVQNRAKNLGIEILHQGREDKIDAIQEIAQDLNITLDQVAHIGDDLPDLPVIRKVGLGVTVPNGADLMKEHAHHCTTRSGGKGAVRELCELIMKAQDTLADAHAFYLK
ncbi:KdsC family phosphatase [Litoribrevibacter euphylliae]|uniref:3-deoxy-D-manno-octulosonate 8-phosphate phosphatase KdsC n=1 Tax=Litoribrevibacter euphylliae TaxID=1834034 RepID=A0ABV7H9T6_9GAMM